ncbi:hypothetical protein ACFLU8_01095 [Chloroflexota bacterium]
MAPRFEKGQKVIIVPVKNHGSLARHSDLESYSGQTGEVADFYWVNIGLDVPKAFYVYTVRIEDNDIVVHEDELERIID